MSDSSPEALFFVDLRVFKVASGEKFCGVVTKSVEAVDFIFLFSLLTENASVVLSSWAEAAQYRQLPQSRAAFLASGQPALVGRCRTQIPNTDKRIIFPLVVN